MQPLQLLSGGMEPHLVLLVRCHGGGNVAELHEAGGAAGPTVHLHLLEAWRAAEQLLQLRLNYLHIGFCGDCES